MRKGMLYTPDADVLNHGTLIELHPRGALYSILSKCFTIRVAFIAEFDLIVLLQGDLTPLNARSQICT